MSKEHWVTNTINNIIYSVPTGVNNYRGKKKYYSTGSIQTSKHVEEGEYLFDEKPSRANRIALSNDVFQARMKNTNKPILIDKSLEGCLFSTGFLQLRPFGATYNSKLLYYYIQSKDFITQKDDLTTGSTQEALTDANAVNLEFPLPPLNEQKRIVEKLDTILPKVKTVKARLEKIPPILKKFRQSVIMCAFNGELTSDWRDNINKETGQSLLELIVRVRTQRKRTEEINQQNVQLDLPDTWIITNIDSISDEVVDCPHSTPKWSKTGKLCLRTNNFLANKLNLNEKRFVDKVVFNQRTSRLKPKQGDILYSREGGILGIACILNIEEDVCLGQRMMLFRVNKNINNKYICYFMNSPIINNHVNMLTGGSAAPHINVGDIKEYPIPFPPFNEQNEIVHRIEKLFALADSLEAKYKKAMVSIEKIEQAVLAKAFRGELIEADPDDEPAEELLKKIIAEKEKDKVKIYKKKR